MRTNARSLPALAAALLLAASAAVVSGCGNPKSEGPSGGGNQNPGKKASLSPPKAIAFVTYTTNATAAQLTVVGPVLGPSLPDNKTPLLKQPTATSSGDEVWWVPLGTPVNSKLQIVQGSWTPKMPFVKDPVYDPNTGILSSGPPSQGSGNSGGTPCPVSDGTSAGKTAQCYDYVAFLVLPDGTTRQIDPHIGIMP